MEIKPSTYTSGPGLLNTLSVSEARIHLPPDIPATPDEIIIQNATLNEEGFTGRVTMVFDPPPQGEDPEKLFGVIPIDFRSIILVIENNIPVEFELKVAVELPYFDEWVDMTISLNDEFDLRFRIEAVDPEGITLTKEELLSLTFKSAEYKHTDGVLEMSLSGGMEPLLWNADGLEWPRLDVTELAVEQDIYSLLNGRPEPPIFRFKEAWLDLKDLATLDLFGFHFELNKVGIGYIESTDELWVDLTGSLKLIELMPVGLGVEGFRITWPRRIYEELNINNVEQLTSEQTLALASKIQVKFDGVYIFFGVPQTVEFEGYIRFMKEAQLIGFAGDVAIRMPSAGLAIEAGLMAGMSFEEFPIPFLYVYFGIQLPTGIPLGQSGLALKGAKGLFGLNVVPDREPEQNPYHDWYKRGPIEGAHPTNKWRYESWSIAFGAGVTITTTDGKILGVEGLLALAIPGPIIFIEGKALVFDGVFPIDSPLKALGYFDGNELTTQINIEASFELVEGVIDVMAGIEAFFDFKNLTNWHLYLGQDQPKELRVHANFLQLPAIGWLFGADAYLMLDMADEDTLRSRLGVHIGFEPPAIDLAVASAKVYAVLEGEGLLTINPFMFTGGLNFDAVIDLNAFGLVVFGAEATATMSVDGALPLVADALISARVDLPTTDFEEVPLVGDHLASALDWFEETVAELPEIPDYLEIEIPFHWELDRPPAIDPIVKGVSVESRFAQGGVEALRLNHGEIENAPTVPLDARPTIMFDQNMNILQHLEFGGFSAGQLERFRSGKLTFIPRILRIRLFKLPNHAFINGNHNENWIEIADTDLNSSKPLWGMFRPIGEFADHHRASRRTLELWATNIFESLSSSIPISIPSNSESTASTLISPLDSLGLEDIPWCKKVHRQVQCIDSVDFKKIHTNQRQQITAVFTDNRWVQHLKVHAVLFIAENLRTHKQHGQFLLQADTNNRREESLAITFPEKVVAAKLTLTGKLTGVKALNRTLTITPNINIQDQAGRTQVDINDASGFDCVKLATSSSLNILEVCWLTAEEVELENVTRLECETNALVSSRAANTSMVFSPGAYYRIEIETSVELDEARSDAASLLLASLPGFSDAIAPYRHDMGGPKINHDTFYFRTEGPPSTLSPYIKWISPIHNHTAHFADDDIVIRFNRSYIHQLFPDDDNGATRPPGSPYALEAYIEDANGKVLRNSFLNWTSAASATLTPEEQYWYEHIAPQSTQNLVPLADDILEIRRRLSLQSFDDVSRDEWQVLTLNGTASRRPKWQHIRKGVIHAKIAESNATNLYVARNHEWSEAKLTVRIVPSNRSGTFGIVFLYSDENHHYQLRLTGLNYNTIQIVRVSPEGEHVLSTSSLSHAPNRRPARSILPSRLLNPGLRDRPRIYLHRQFNTVVTTQREGSGIKISCTINGQNISAYDATPVEFSGGAGLLCQGTNAQFDTFSIGPIEEELKPSSRYQVTLAGGAGGRTLHQDRFTGDSLEKVWQNNTSGWTSGPNGLQASGPGAQLAYNDIFDDGEVITIIEASEGDKIAIMFRTPDGRRSESNRFFYNLEVERTNTHCNVELNLSRDGLPPHQLAYGHAHIGNAAKLTIRVRLYADVLRVWVFDEEVINTYLEEVRLNTISTRRNSNSPVDMLNYHTPRDRIHHTFAALLEPRRHVLIDTGMTETIPIIRRGALQWRVTNGTPSLREVHIREVALLDFSFTTSAYHSFTDVVNHLTHALADTPIRTDKSAAEISAIMATATTSQREYANQLAAFQETSALFDLKRAARPEVEEHRQALIKAGADHNENLTHLMAEFGLAPLITPKRPTIQRVELTNGQTAGYLVQSKESLDPVRILSSETSSFSSLGRTTFELMKTDGSIMNSHWLTSCDGTSVFIYRINEGVTLNNHTSGNDLKVLINQEHASQLSIRYTRDHADEQSLDFDHRFDRPYHVSAGSRDDVELLIDLPEP